MSDDVRERIVRQMRTTAWEAQDAINEIEEAAALEAGADRILTLLAREGEPVGPMVPCPECGDWISAPEIAALATAYSKPTEPAPGVEPVGYVSTDELADLRDGIAVNIPLHREAAAHGDPHYEVALFAHPPTDTGETEALRAEVERLRTAVAFARSVIKGGEKWTDKCEEMLTTQGGSDR